MYLISKKETGPFPVESEWLLHYDQSCDLVCLSDFDGSPIKKKDNARNDLDREVFQDAAFGAAFSISVEFGEECATPGDVSALSDSDAILGGDEGCESEDESIRNSATANVAETSAIAEITNRDFKRVGIIYPLIVLGW